MSVFDKGAQEISGPKTDEVAGGWRKPYNELHTLHFSPSTVMMIKSRRMRWVGHARNEKCIQIFGLKETGWADVDWVHLYHNRHWWHSCKHGNQHSGYMKNGNLTSCMTISFSRTLLHVVSYGIATQESDYVFDDLTSICSMGRNISLLPCPDKGHARGMRGSSNLEHH
jgi:hypothetical protein